MSETNTPTPADYIVKGRNLYLQEDFRYPDSPVEDQIQITGVYKKDISGTLKSVNGSIRKNDQEITSFSADSINGEMCVTIGKCNCFFAAGALVERLIIAIDADYITRDEQTQNAE